MCDKKNSVLFTETECLVLSPDFKLIDESQVLLRVPRQNNMYNFDLKNVVPSGDLTLTDDFSRFSWVFFLATKSETSGILKKFITEIENQLNHKVKVIRSDNGTKFKNREMDEFRGQKEIKRVLVTKPHNKTPYELIIGRAPSISFMRPFRCPVTILNTLDPLGKFDGKAEEGFLVGYSVNSKAFRVFNTETRKVKENLHVNFLENKPNIVGQDQGARKKEQNQNCLLTMDDGVVNWGEERLFLSRSRSWKKRAESELFVDYG
ncbi:ribonuclease H-like domain-containing protein [Tanacetum coccineum]